MAPCDEETQAPFAKAGLSEDDFLLDLHSLGEEEMKGVGGEYATCAHAAPPPPAAAPHHPLPVEGVAEPSVSSRGVQWGSDASEFQTLFESGEVGAQPGRNLLGGPENVGNKSRAFSAGRPAPMKLSRAAEEEKKDGGKSASRPSRLSEPEAKSKQGPPPLAPQRTGAPLAAIEEEGESSRRGSVESLGCGYATPRTSAGSPGHSLHQHQPQKWAPLDALPLLHNVPAQSSSSSLSSSADPQPTSPMRRGAGRNREKGMDDGAARGENPAERRPPTPSPRRSPMRSPVRTPRSPIGSPVRSPRRRGTTSAELQAVRISPSSHFAPAKGAFATTREETLDNGPGAPPRTLSKAKATIQRGPPRSVQRGGQLLGAGQDAGGSRGKAPKLASEIIVFDSSSPPCNVAEATSAAGSELLELDIRALLDVQNEAKEEVAIDALSSQLEIFARGDFHVSDLPCAPTPEGEVENFQGPFLDDGSGDGLAFCTLPLPAASNGHEKDLPAPQQSSANGQGPSSRDHSAIPGEIWNDSAVQDSSDESSRKHSVADATEVAGNARRVREAFECLNATFVNGSNGTGSGSPGILGGGHGATCSDDRPSIRFDEQQAMPPANAGFDSARVRSSPRGTVPRIRRKPRTPLSSEEGERQTINVPLSLKTEAASHATCDPLPVIKLPLEVAVETVPLDPLPSAISLSLDAVQNHEVCLDPKPLPSVIGLLLDTVVNRMVCSR
jgi:hypothetical protein